MIDLQVTIAKFVPDKVRKNMESLFLLTKQQKQVSFM